MKIKSILRYFSKRKIGEGWDYVVFQSYSDKRKVVKILRPEWKHVWSRKMMPSRVSEILRNPMQKQMLETAENLKNLISLNGGLFANPRFIGTSYTQDKLVTLREHIKHCSTMETLIILKKYLEFQNKCWSIGVADLTFKFSGYGVTLDNEIVLLDLSRLTFDRKQIEELVSKKKWLRILDAKLLPRFSREYFKEISNESFEVSASFG